MLMVVLQEVGIQGSHMNWPGARLDIPFHLAGLSPFLSGSAAGHHPVHLDDELDGQYRLIVACS
ncbi:uncharacterized protein ASPGLDRAFT_52861 [Aspergillus glaucus CBS 516.65]|uniref:Uncharacterized protein n=1 Tax=Aspergillus glaucus CBS 516.65 TaxID=1160497 RepID=A0A1L9V5M9_ASPGL|nr:hypothetical protein ASPGLDRAFT_52861 [Aspergillus glaucus CBS 516.65]OJJ79234.1 hypothetical protein ASPGLDRAFT_52861 [Aspergillus glaucus CBS 516.65]